MPPRPVHDGGEIDLHDRVYAEGTPAFRVCHKSGGCNHCLAGRTPEIHAGTPWDIRFEQHHRMACVRERAGKGDASLARTDNRCLCLD